MLLVFLLAAAAQLVCWWVFLLNAFHVGKRPRRNLDAAPPPVSVIVCFRNEAPTLRACLESILAQAYAGDFEILAVDDNSTDASATIVRELQRRHGDHLRLLAPGPTRPGKKDALTYGVHHARHELLLLTDADCVAASGTWLDQMTLPLAWGNDVVLGVGEYAGGSGTLLHRFQRYETIYVALKYLGLAAGGLPYMGVGRNLAYRRSFFMEAGGLASHADLPGGDDDLLIGHHARADRTARVTWPEARTVSRLSPDWRTFLLQRRRHQSTGTRYAPKIQALLGGIALSHGLFFLLGFVLLFTEWWLLALGAYLLRFLLVFAAVRSSGLRGAAAGAVAVEPTPLVPVWEVALLDALVAPFYLYLAIVDRLPGGTGFGGRTQKPAD